MVSPPYCATTVWAPIARSDTGRTAWPFESSGARPRLTPSMMKVTLPVGIPVPALGFTVAFKWTTWPKIGCDGVELATVLVVWSTFCCTLSELAR